MSAITQATSPAARADRADVGGPIPRDPSAPAQSLIVEEFIARVLHRAHHAAHASDAPSEARAVLGLAQLFADELATISWRFDRVRFIHAVTQERA
jgi:hypothetical protein